MTNALYGIPLKQVDGTASSLARYRGKVLLVVNVASKCGMTPQYEGLERLYQDQRAKGVEVLGFPANNFQGQEPGSEAEIGNFCSVNYDIHLRHPPRAVLEAIGPGRRPASVVRAVDGGTAGGHWRWPLPRAIQDAWRESSQSGGCAVELREVPDQPRVPGCCPFRARCYGR